MVKEVLQNMNKIIGVSGFIDDYKIIISAGAIDGISEGMDLNILSKNGEEVKDPFSGEVLGKISNIKAQVKVITVKERFSICVIKDQPLPPHVIHNALPFFKQRFKFDGKPIQRQITDEPIKIGDIVEI